MYLNVSLYALMLAAAGLPLYIHLPRYASAELGLGLATVGAILIGIRFLDFLQDPGLGWLVDRFPEKRTLFAAIGAGGMGLGFLMLFSLPPALPVATWLVLSLVILFTCYSLASILFYGQSTALARGSDNLIRLAGYREAGSLTGVILAALLPVALISAFGDAQGFAVYGVCLALLCLFVHLSTKRLWTPEPAAQDALSFAALRSSGALNLLALALINAMPVAMTSTLFLFFVEDRLMLGGMAGPLLVLFFLAAGLSVPLWTRASRRHGPRAILLIAMPLAVASFIGAALLPAGALVPFALVCIGSGAALGADMVLLPVLFSGALDRAGLRAGQAFGLWFLAGKLALALSAALLLPALEIVGFQPGTTNSPQALNALALSYAVLPCLIKLAAIAMLLRIPQEVLSQ